MMVRDAIAGGIFNDLGSGSNVDICVITKDKVEYLRPFDMANKKGVRWVASLNRFIFLFFLNIQQCFNLLNGWLVGCLFVYLFIYSKIN